MGGQLMYSLSISLSGLLDYGESDTDEETMELSLFAEGFSEMLMHDFGSNIYSFIVKDRCPWGILWDELLGRKHALLLRRRQPDSYLGVAADPAEQGLGFMYGIRSHVALLC